MNDVNVMGSFLKWCEALWNMLLLNMIWLVFNFPLVYLLIDIAYRKTIEEMFGLLIVMVCLLPFLYFPATATLFAIIRRWVMKRSVKNMFTTFWRFYKANYKRSFLSSFIFILLFFIWLMNVRVSFVSYHSLLFYIYVLIFFMIVSLMHYFYADMVHFKISVMTSLHKVIYMSVFYLPYTISAAAITCFIFIVLFMIHPILLFLFGGGMMAYVYFFTYYQIYLRAQAKVEREH